MNKRPRVCYELIRPSLRLLHRRVVGIAQRSTCNGIGHGGLGSSWPIRWNAPDRVARKNTNLGWASLVWIDAVRNGMVLHNGLIVSELPDRQSIRVSRAAGTSCRHPRRRTAKTSTTYTSSEAGDGGRKVGSAVCIS